MGYIVPTVTQCRNRSYILRGMEIKKGSWWEVTAWWGDRLTTRGARMKWLAYIKALVSVITYRLTGNPMFLS